MITLPDLSVAALLAIAVFVIAYGGTRALIGILSSRPFLDNPNDRSSHDTPTPRGGGIAILAALLPAWLLIGMYFQVAPVGSLTIITVAIVLAAISWIDDLRGIAPAPRLAFQTFGVVAALIFAPLPGPVFVGWLPPIVDLALTALLWLWFINLFNFISLKSGVQS